MKFSFTVGCIFIFSGVLYSLVSLPLIRRKVKMNEVYGIRTSESFASEQNWYAINEFGGRKLLQLGCMWAGGGLVMIFISNLLAATILSLFLVILLWQMSILPIQQYSESLRNNSAQ